MERHRVDFTRICLKRKYCSQSIIRSVSLYNERLVRNPMSEDRSGNERGLNVSNDFLAASEKFHGVLFRVKRVSGTTMSEYPEIKRR